MPDKTFYAVIAAGLTATISFFKSSYSIKKSNNEMGKRVLQAEKDIRTCFGTNRDSYVEKNFCSLQSKTLEDKVNIALVDTKALREAQETIKGMMNDVHNAVCNRMKNERRDDGSKTSSLE